jgi:hypothetical protein
MEELNLGADWEQSKRLVAHWHDRWAKAQLEVDWYEAPEQIKYVCRLYSELSKESQAKIDNLMQALKDCK